MQGQPLKGKNNIQTMNVHLIENEHDISLCNELCMSAYGFTRETELRHAISQGVATILEHEGITKGYAAGIGMFGHAVAQSNEDLKTLIANTHRNYWSWFFFNLLGTRRFLFGCLRMVFALVGPQTL